ncbi:MAG: putative nucleotidyltransferase substrate binding domain-containing protein [Actinomycetota bacterium]
MDPASFLAANAPFDELPADDLVAVIGATEIVFFLGGETVLEAGGEVLDHLFVVRTGGVELLDEGHVVDQLGEGEIFGALSLLSGERPLFTVRAHEETICYRIGRAAAEAALASPAGVSFLSRSLRRRERTLLVHAGVTAADPWTMPLGQIATASIVQVSGDASIREAAAMMATARASSVFVREADGWAIMTDRDLRVRVVAEGVDTDTSVRGVASSPLLSLPADATAAEALSLMLEGGIHHVPVTEAGDVLAVITDTDLLALERRSVLRLRRELEAAPTFEEAVTVALQVPRALADLVLASMDPLAVGHLAAVFRDTLTARLIDLTVQRLGSPPCPWSWLALGSQARFEQGLVTDQDHALVFEPGEALAEDLDPYFASLAAGVTQGLVDAGTPRCRAGVIAEERDWRGPLQEWTARFATWSHDRDPGALGRAAIAFDHRAVAGPLDIDESFARPLAAVGAELSVQRRLGRWVIDRRPPRGFLRAAIVEGRGTRSLTFDVKDQGIALVTSLARVLALRAGVRENRTGARLRAAVRAGVLEPRDGEALEEAFALLWQVRLDHQAAQVRDGLPPDDLVDPRRLGPLTRQGLREAFRRIDAGQQVVALELGLR